jgi:hypothetical protein
MVGNRKEKEEKKNVVSSAIKNTNHTNNAINGSLTFELGMKLPEEFYPLGPSARFIYDIGNGYFTYFDESLFDLTGHRANEVVFADPVDFILHIVIDEHLVVVSELTKESFLLCKNYRNGESISLNLEYNIKTKKGEQKRILCQYAPVYFEEDGHPKINKGRLVDITHLKKDGVPLLYIIVDNKMVLTKQGDPQQMMKSKNIIFSNKEVEVLRLISEGYTIKETASFLKCSIARVYTHRKNIRLKSNTDINKSMSNLKERGII